MKFGRLGKLASNASTTFPDEPDLTSASDLGTPGARAKRHLGHRLTRECEAMAQHALSTGHTVPVEVMELLDRASSSIDTQPTLCIPVPTGPDRNDSNASASPQHILTS